MKTHSKQPKNNTSALQAKAKNQAQEGSILQAYKKGTAQLQSLEEEEPVQGKFETAQLEGLAEEDEEPAQLKASSSIQRQAKIQDLENNTGSDFENISGAAESKDTSGSHHDPHVKKDRPARRVEEYKRSAGEERLEKSKQQTLNRLNGELNIEKRKRKPNQEKIVQLASNAQQMKDIVQAENKANKTGLPDNLKSGIENLSGHNLDDVKVHYNSAKPAELQAHAYAQGTDIHIGPGQEKHLPHEAWHVVQQKQGRVKPTKQLKGTTPVNDDTGLEKEADVMGAKAMQLTASEKTSQFKKNTPSNEKGTIQKFDELKTPRSTLNPNGKAAFDLLTNNRTGFKSIEKSGGDENAIQDSKKRVTRVSKKISSEAAPRDQQLQTTIGWLGNLEEENTGAGYNGGHLIASSLGGSGTWQNMVPQDGPENKWGDWRQYEKENRKAIDDTGDSLYVTVQLGYSGDSVLPNSWDSWMTDKNGKDLNWYSALFT